MDFSKILGKSLVKYYKSPDHPFKLRIFFAFNRFLDLFKYRITVPYYNTLWISLSLSDYIDRVIFQKGEYEAEVYNSLIPYSKQNEVLWDIGSHMGSFALKAVDNDAVNSIYCFEPNPDTFKILTRNRDLNSDKKKLHIYNFGLGDKKVSAPYKFANNGNSGGGQFVKTDDGDFSKLPIDTIDNLVFNDHLPPPTLIKIDVEGFELSVFNGAKKTFEQFPPKAIIFESETDNGALKNAEIAAFFKKYDYRISLVECEDEQGGPYNNFLAIKN